MTTQQTTNQNTVTVPDILRAKVRLLGEEALAEVDNPNSIMVQMHGWFEVCAAAADERAQRVKRRPGEPMTRATVRHLARGLAQQKGRKLPADREEFLSLLGLGVNLAAETVALCDEVTRVEEERDALRRVRERLTTLALRRGATAAEVGEALDGEQRGQA